MAVTRPRVPASGWRCGLCGFLAVALLAGAGCGSKEGKETTDPEAKLRLERLLKAYQFHVAQKKKGPANEQEFKEFILKLPPDKREELRVGDDVDGLFVSPRDGQKFVIRYNLKLAPGGETQAVAWERDGQNGKRFVALSVGYVQEGDEEYFKTLKK
jgi:hypothetical protein